MRVQLELPGAIEDHHVVLRVPFQLFGQPIVHVILEVLHAEHERAVRAEVFLLHDVFEGDEFANVRSHRVAEVVRRRVEVDHVHRSTDRGAVLMDVVTVRRFTRTRGTDDELSVRHGG